MSRINKSDEVLFHEMYYYSVQVSPIVAEDLDISQ
jgi:hypothetical protein